MLLVRPDARLAVIAPSLYLGAGVAFFVGSVLVARTMHGPGATILPLLPLVACGVALSFGRLLRWDDRQLRVLSLGGARTYALASLRFVVVVQKNRRGGWFYFLHVASPGQTPARVSLHLTEAGAEQAVETLAMGIRGIPRLDAHAEAKAAMAARVRV